MEGRLGWVGGWNGIAAGNVRRVLLLLKSSVVDTEMVKRGWGVFTRACVLCVDGLELGHLIPTDGVAAKVSELSWSSKKGCVREFSW